MLLRLGDLMNLDRIFISSDQYSRERIPLSCFLVKTWYDDRLCECLPSFKVTVV